RAGRQVLEPRIGDRRSRHRERHDRKIFFGKRAILAGNLHFKTILTAHYKGASRFEHGAEPARGFALGTVIDRQKCVWAACWSSFSIDNHFGFRFVWRIVGRVVDSAGTFLGNAPLVWRVPVDRPEQEGRRENRGKTSPDQPDVLRRRVPGAPRRRHGRGG